MTAVFDTAEALNIRRTESLTSLVRRELERMIESGELQGGDRLNENLLATKLGVSRGPVREACRGLEQSGLVDVIVNRGVFVRTHGPLIRMGTDRFSRARRAAGHSAQQDDLNTFYPLNLQFHHAITDYGGNERLMVLASAIQREAHLFRRRTLHMPGRMLASNAEHRSIVAALAAHDAIRAGTEMEAHVMNSRIQLFGVPGQPAP